MIYQVFVSLSENSRTSGRDSEGIRKLFLCVSEHIAQTQTADSFKESDEKSQWLLIEEAFQAQHDFEETSMEFAELLHVHGKLRSTGEGNKLG